MLLFGYKNIFSHIFNTIYMYTRSQPHYILASNFKNKIFINSILSKILITSQQGTRYNIHNDYL